MRNAAKLGSKTAEYSLKLVKVEISYMKNILMVMI